MRGNNDATWCVSHDETRKSHTCVEVMADELLRVDQLDQKWLAVEKAPAMGQADPCVQMSSRIVVAPDVLGRTRGIQ